MTFSIQQDCTTKYDINQSRGTHPHTRQVRRRLKRWGGVGSSPSASGSTFFVGNRPVKVCKKLALSVCEDMRLPQRSMAYGWDEWNGDNKVSGGATGVWGCTFSLGIKGKCVCWVTHTHRHMHTLVISCTHEDTKQSDTGQGHTILESVAPTV